MRIGLEQWHQDTYAIGGKLVLCDDLRLAARGMRQQYDRSRGRIDHQRLVGREETFKGQVQQPFLAAVIILGFMCRVTHRQTYPDILLSRTYRGDFIAPSPIQKRSNPLDTGPEQVVPLLRSMAGRMRPELGLWYQTMCSV
jgi:hypothetical protein